MTHHLAYKRLNPQRLQWPQKMTIQPFTCRHLSLAVNVSGMISIYPSMNEWMNAAIKDQFDTYFREFIKIYSSWKLPAAPTLSQDENSLDELQVDHPRQPRNKIRIVKREVKPMFLWSIICKGQFWTDKKLLRNLILAQRKIISWLVFLHLYW